MAGKPKKSVSIQPYAQTQDFGYYNAPQNLRTGALGVADIHNRISKRIPAIPEGNYRAGLGPGELKFANQLKASKANLATGVNVPPMTARRYGNTKRSRTRKLLRTFITPGPNPSPNIFDSQYNYETHMKYYPRAKEEWNQLVAENEAAAVMAGTESKAEANLINASESPGVGGGKKRKTRKSKKTRKVKKGRK